MLCLTHRRIDKANKGLLLQRRFRQSMLLAALALATYCSVGHVPADKVTKLPGWKGKLPSDHYSGYLSVGNLSKAPGTF